MIATPFVVGQLVRLKADHSRTGSVIEVAPAPDNGFRYLVFHSASDQRSYFHSQIEAVEHQSPTSQLHHLIKQDQWLEPEAFRAGLTAARLANPEVDSLYALQSARIQFVPFQFKPLLRFLRADRPRLLIADEVGVGKTIEAGLILRELQTRQDVRNVIVVCPKSLVHKWRMEMLRFDEDFRPLSSENLRYCLREADLDGVWPAQFNRVICHLELLRMESYLTQLVELDPPPVFDLAIFDEAHHVRTPTSLSHELARAICDRTEAVVFLSATPMQVGSSNLHFLLNLLRPDLFPQESVFNEIVEPNSHIILAMRHVRSRQPAESWQGDAFGALETAAATRWGSQTIKTDPRWILWRERLTHLEPLTDEERIKCLRDLEELHTLSHVMNRTRRRDIGKFTIREPIAVNIPFTPAQQHFYDSLLDFRRDILSLQYDPMVIRLIMDTLERQASSCLPALAELLDVFIVHGKLSGFDLTDVEDLDLEEVAIPNGLQGPVIDLRSAAAVLKNEPDPKLAALHQILDSALAEEGPGKVLVFSFFLHTLSYLLRAIELRGVRVALITGGTPDEERELLRERFRLPRSHPDRIDVLLSSEVGCEGLDYEFCDRLVNYDIPWNPMRIEQRIGRIDRFGQASPKVLIYNFVTPGTVEERIFYRCFERLGVFRETVGDLEEVLGELVGELNHAALNPTLSAEDSEAIAAQAADNAIREIEEINRLEAESDRLVGLDEVFLRDVNDVLGSGRYVSQDAVRQLVERYLQETLGAELLPDADEGIVRLRLDKDKRAQLSVAVKVLKRQDRPTTAFIKWLDGSEPQLRVTFVQEVALDRRDIPFVTPVHPLCRAAVRGLTRNKDPLLGTLTCTDELVASGRYAFVCELWERVGLTPEVQLKTFAWDLDRDEFSESASNRLLILLEEARAPEAMRSHGDLEQALSKLEGMSHQRWTEDLAQYKNANRQLLDRRLAVLHSYHDARRQRVEAELQRVTEAKVVRMKEAERDRIEKDFRTQVLGLEQRKESDIISERIAAGVIEVLGAS